jgi:hypothetical protein
MFKLIVDDSKRDEFESYYQDISISGFDNKKYKNKSIKIQIQAIPFNNNWGTPKASKPCVCHI